MLEFKNLQIPYVNEAGSFLGDLKFQQTGLICLIGRNGCGKSTFLKTLCGLEKPVSGEILLNHKVVDANVRDFFSLCPPHLQLAFDLPLVELVALAAAGRRDNAAAVDEVIGRLKLTPFKHVMYSKLSSGYQKLASIGYAIAKPSSVLLLDEPFANLDLDYRRLILEVLLKESKNKLVIVSSHMDASLLQNFEKTIILGSPILYGNTDQILSSDVFSERTGAQTKRFSCDGTERFFFVSTKQP